LKTVVHFNHVSKLYRLGLTRTSVLRTLTNSLKKVINHRNRENDENLELWALRDVSFELSQGESLGLIGKNGAGKSTILKLLAKITQPTSGDIDIKGKLSALIELGSGFHPDLTGRDNIYLNGTILGLSKNDIKRHFDEIVDFSELERFIDTPVKRYSSGMTVRLGFAVAACIKPDILLVDEVLAVGDASFRQKCMNRIHSLINDGTTIIFVSHNLYMVQAVCPSALYIVDGRVKFQGKTLEAIDAYERDFHEERARKYEISKQNHEDPMTDVQINKVEILDANSFDTPAEFHSEQTVEVRIHYSAFGSNRSANAVVRLVRTDGVTCCMVRTSIDKILLNLHQGEGFISVTLDPLQVTGGTYYVDARITNTSDTVVLSTAWSDWFYVSGSALSHEEQSGVFEPRRRWEHHKLSEYTGNRALL
jgi:lipopolysaccharide transport system ATP-binding protein